MPHLRLALAQINATVGDISATADLVAPPIPENTITKEPSAELRAARWTG